MDSRHGFYVSRDGLVHETDIFPLGDIWTTTDTQTDKVDFFDIVTPGEDFFGTVQGATRYAVDVLTERRLSAMIGVAAIEQQIEEAQAVLSLIDKGELDHVTGGTVREGQDRSGRTPSLHVDTGQTVPQDAGHVAGHDQQPRRTAKRRRRT